MKRSVRLGIVASAIGVMAAVIVIFDTSEEPYVAEEPSFTLDETDRVIFFAHVREDIVRIVIRRDDSEVVVTRRGRNRFLPVHEHEVEWDTSAVNRLVSASVSMVSQRVIGVVSELAEFGLSEPIATVIIETTDGSETALFVGNRTPARDGFFVRRSDDPNVYSVEDRFINAFFQDIDQLRARNFPQIDVNRPDRFSVKTLDGRLIRAERRAEGDDDPELGFSLFAVYEPYRRRYQLNTGWFQDLSAQIQELSIVRFVDDAPADLSIYGLDPPEAEFFFVDRNTRSLELLIGSVSEDGRYAKFPDRPSVFVVSGVEPIVSVSPKQAISAFALIVNIDLVDSFEIRTATERFVGRVERTNVESQNFPEEVFLFNDVEIEARAFRQLFQWAIGLMFDREVSADSAIVVGEQEPIVTITYHLNIDAPPLIVSFEPYDDRFALVVRDGDSEFLIARSKLERMVRAFMNQR